VKIKGSQAIQRNELMPGLYYLPFWDGLVFEPGLKLNGYGECYEIGTFSYDLKCREERLRRKCEEISMLVIY